MTPTAAPRPIQTPNPRRRLSFRDFEMLAGYRYEAGFWPYRGHASSRTSTRRRIARLVARGLLAVDKPAYYEDGFKIPATHKITRAGTRQLLRNIIRFAREVG